MKELPEDIVKIGFQIGNLNDFSNNEVTWATELFWSIISAVFVAASGLNGTGIPFRTEVSIKMQYKDRGGTGPIECLVVTAKNIGKSYLLRDPNVAQYSPVVSDLSGPSLAAPISIWVSVKFYSTPEALEEEKQHGLNVINQSVVGCIMEAMEDRENRPVQIGNIFLTQGKIRLRKRRHEKEVEDNTDENEENEANDENDDGDDVNDVDAPDDSDNPDDADGADDDSP